MFTSTRVRLTFFYSLLFFVLFWIFSFGIYIWMERSFGENYISEVQQHQSQQTQIQNEFGESQDTLTTIAGDVALSRLRAVLLTINGIFIFIVPVISWWLAQKSLKPIEASQEKQNQFVADASHELRTPLSVMIAEIDVLLKKARPIGDYVRILKSNREELDRLSLLVKNLLFLAKDGAKKQTLQMEDIDLTDLVSSILISFKPIYQKKKLTVQFHPAEDSVVVRGNSSDFRQLFTNIIDNAIKYTPKGKIQVNLDQTNKFATVSISDTGIGISPEHQKQLFDRFYRVEMSRSETKGYGLGLSICKAIIDRYHGTITVNSNVNLGSTFTVVLPR